MATGSMDDLADRVASRAVRSAFIYTREAHPGENYRHHRTMDDKRRNARAYLEHSKVRRQRAGPQAVADYQRMLEANKVARAAPTEDVGPRIPGNFYKTEGESGNR